MSMQTGTVNSMARNEAVVFQTTAGTTLRDVVQFASGGGTLIQSSESTDASARFRYDVDDKIGFVVSWGCTHTSTSPTTITVEEGSDRRAWQNGQGSYTFYPNGHSSGSSGNFACKRWLLGPLETARFAITSTSTAYSGRNEVQVTITTDATSFSNMTSANVMAFRMPDVSFST